MASNPAMSPRRSSRARTTQPPPGPQHTHSSTSSSASGRTDRSTRSHHKVQSPGQSVPPRSESIDEGRERRSDLPQTRQRKRGAEEDKALPVAKVIGAVEDNAEEEEVTRCVCGELEYPGMPVLPVDSLKRRNSKPGVTEAKTTHPSTAPSEPAPEDAGGLFIQCDTCKVWQHGGCVGVMDETMNPEEYFCEQCRPDLHVISVGPNG